MHWSSAAARTGRAVRAGSPPNSKMTTAPEVHHRVLLSAQRSESEPKPGSVEVDWDDDLVVTVIVTSRSRRCPGRDFEIIREPWTIITDDEPVTIRRLLDEDGSGPPWRTTCSLAARELMADRERGGGGSPEPDPEIERVRRRRSPDAGDLDRAEERDAPS